MKTTPKLWLRDGALYGRYKNVKAGISICTPGLLAARVIGDTPTIPEKAKLRVSKTPAKGFKPVWFHSTGLMVWYGYDRASVNGVVPTGLADWMDRNQLLPEERGLHTPVFRLYVKLVRAR